MLDLVVHHYGKPVTVLVPENWNELSGAQLIAIAGIMYAEQDPLRQVFYGKDSPGDLPAELIRSLYNVPALMQILPLRAEMTRLDATHPGAPQRANSSEAVFGLRLGSRRVSARIPSASSEGVSGDHFRMSSMSRD